MCIRTIGLLAGCVVFAHIFSLHKNAKTAEYLPVKLITTGCEAIVHYTAVANSVPDGLTVVLQK